MPTFIDFEGNEIRLSDERTRHIRARHPRVFRIHGAIEATLENPDIVDAAFHDPEVTIYRRHFETPNMGDWWVSVLVVFKPDDAFITTVEVNKSM